MKIEDIYHDYVIGKNIDYNNIPADIIKQLIENIINDKNSSMARESAILTEAKCDTVKGKLNYDGIKDGRYVEVKLRNYDTNNIKTTKLNGEGSYSDYTWERYKHHTSDNPLLLVGGFINGRMIYIFSFDYNAPNFNTHITTKLTNYFGDITQERKPNHYLRSLGFNFSHYNEDAKLIYKCSESVLESNKQYISKKLYDFLKKPLDN